MEYAICKNWGILLDFERYLFNPQKLLANIYENLAALYDPLKYNKYCKCSAGEKYDVNYWNLGWKGDFKEWCFKQELTAKNSEVFEEK